MEEKVILSGEIVEKLGLFKKQTKPIKLTKTKLIIGEKVYLVKDIVEAFNDGIGKLGIKLKNGEQSFALKCPEAGQFDVLLAFDSYSEIMNRVKNLVNRWVDAINTVKVLEE
ncbi:MAG: hypothetical protein WHU54_04725 [Candidatus Bathyarchaeia archaeon]